MRKKLIKILGDSASGEAMDWLSSVLVEQEDNFQQRPFYYAFSGVSRHFNKRGSVTGTPQQIKELDEAQSGFTVEGWDEFRLARVILLLTLAEQEESVFLDTLFALLNTADLREQVAIFSAYSLLPCQKELVESAVDGLRSNIVDIFDSITLSNPFPAANFTEEAWNQMVLKAIFITRPLYRIRNLRDRSNKALTEAISDLAHERWAAGRSITPEAWQNCTNFLDDRLVEDLEKMATSEESTNRAAAALVTTTCSAGRLDHLRENLQSEIQQIDSGELTWDSLGHSMEELLVRKSLT